MVLVWNYQSVIKKKDHSQEDKKVWENYIKDPSDIYDKEGNNRKILTHNKRFKFDLHGFSLDEANKKVKVTIIHCSENKYKEILFITGKGNHSTNEKDIYVSKDLGKLKFSVPEYINNNENLMRVINDIKDATIEDGGSGAFYVLLKKKRSIK